jgi:hypothetical protein
MAGTVKAEAKAKPMSAFIYNSSDQSQINP